jgi:hypothetical protein
MKTITKPVQIKLNGKPYLLEEGDKIDVLNGGLADKHTTEDIAQKHGVDVELITKELDMGAKVELEHTSHPDLATEISLDHLWEIPDYYTRLRKMEEEARTELGLEDEHEEVAESINRNEMLTEAAVHRRYLLVKCHCQEDRCFSPSSANDNYMLYFLERLCNSKRFNSRSYGVKIVKKIPKGCRKMSLETFLKELMPIPKEEKK